MAPAAPVAPVVDIICCLGPFLSELTSGWGRGWGVEGGSLFTEALPVGEGVGV